MIIILSITKQQYFRKNVFLIRENCPRGFINFRPFKNKELPAVVGSKWDFFVS